MYIRIHNIYMYLRTYGQLRVDRRNHVSGRIRSIGRALGFRDVDVAKTGRWTFLFVSLPLFGFDTPYV